MRQVKLWMRAAILFICGASIFTSCTNDDDPVTPPTDEVETQLQKMTLREKVGQLFYVRPECLDTTIHFNLVSTIDHSADDIKKIKLQAVNGTMQGVNEKYPVGGIILYAHNIEDEAQLARFISQIRTLNGSPLLCIDEEGGRVARIGNNENFQVEKFESMGAIGATGDPQNAYHCGNTIGAYLRRYGFDIDFAPVADVNTNPENIVIGARAFSDDPAVAAPMVVNYLQGLKDAGVTGCIKHFPGHGDTKADTHYGYAQSLKTWEQMKDCEMITFKAGIQWGTQLIMTLTSPRLMSRGLTSPPPCRPSSCRTNCAVNWATRTSSSPMRWRWEPSPSSTPMAKPLWVRSRLVPTSCWVRRTSWKPSMPWSRPWKTAGSPNSALTKACAAY